MGWQAANFISEKNTGNVFISEKKTRLVYLLTSNTGALRLITLTPMKHDCLRGIILAAADWDPGYLPATSPIFLQKIQGDNRDELAQFIGPMEKNSEYGVMQRMLESIVNDEGARGPVVARFALGTKMRTAVVPTQLVHRKKPIHSESS